MKGKEGNQKRFDHMRRRRLEMHCRPAGGHDDSWHCPRCPKKSLLKPQTFSAYTYLKKRERNIKMNTFKQGEKNIEINKLRKGENVPRKKKLIPQICE